MPNGFNWLPGLVLFENYNWDEYLEVLYNFYKADFIDTKPKYKNIDVGVKRLPLHDGKESNFWHLIQEAYQTKEEDDRIPDLRRCERIRWPRPIIEHVGKSVILLWENTRHSKSGIEANVCMWLKEKEYLVVLRKRKRYFLLWTAYPVTKEHIKRKLQKEYEVYQISWGRHF